MAMCYEIVVCGSWWSWRVLVELELVNCVADQLIEVSGGVCGGQARG